MKLGCCGLGIFGIIFKALGKVIEAIVAFIVYLGLYYPLFYGVVIFFLWVGTGTTFAPHEEQVLLYVGLGISLVCSVVVTLRHLIFEPFGRFLDRRQEKRERKMLELRAKRESRRRRELEEEKRRAVRYDRERRRPSYDEYDRRDYRMERPRHERPYVYRSRNNREIIIYEYSDRFEVFREGERGLRHIDTKWKR